MGLLRNQNTAETAVQHSLRKQPLRSQETSRRMWHGRPACVFPKIVMRIPRLAPHDYSWDQFPNGAPNSPRAKVTCQSDCSSSGMAAPGEVKLQNASLASYTRPPPETRSQKSPGKAIPQTITGAQSTAPCSSRNWTISVPASTSVAAAKGVRIRLSNRLTSAPFSTRNLTISNCFARTALWRGV